MLQEEDDQPICPRARELSIDDLNELKDDAQLFGQSESDMVETLSGGCHASFGVVRRFDTLIGDVNDPHLEQDAVDAVPRDEKTDVLLADLLALTKLQGRAGLYKPKEAKEGRPRNFVSGLVDNAPKASRLSDTSKEEVTATLNGSWRLLCTNSEMFGL
jgi:hypothetical protein